MKEHEHNDTKPLRPAEVGAALACTMINFFDAQQDVTDRPKSHNACAVNSAYPRREPVPCRRTVADNNSLAIVSLLLLEIRKRYDVLPSLPDYYAPNIYH
jgi:hypothetical protein